jgi:hypothetical protein
VSEDASERASASDFLRASGLLFEINRTILHPLGLALAVTAEPDPRIDGTFDRFWLNRTEDKAGWIFEEIEISVLGNALVAFLNRPENLERFAARRKELGYIIQGTPAESVTLAEAGYRAYGDFVGWQNYAGLPMPKWGELPEKIRGAWGAAITGAIQAGRGGTP